jgi:AcrR family transcriptional regulator
LQGGAASRGSKATEYSGSAKERILAAAERMFADAGFDGVSLREVTSVAGVNVAAVHYYFGSKEALIEEIFARRSGPIAARRLELLAECAERPGRPPLLEQLIEAFVTPAFEVSRDPGGAPFMRLRARLAYESGELSRRLFYRSFDDSSAAYIAALREALPEMPPEELYWRFYFLLGAMTYTMANPGRIQQLSEGLCNPGDVKRALRHLVPFIAAGFRTPALADPDEPASKPLAAKRSRGAGTAPDGGRPAEDKTPEE